MFVSRIFYARSSEISARATVLWWGLIFAATVLSGNSGVQPHTGESNLFTARNPAWDPLSSRSGILFRRHESRGAAAFPRNYCLPVNSRIFRQPTRGVSELESYREAVSRRNGVELWFHSGKQKCWECSHEHRERDIRRAWCMSLWYPWAEKF